MRTLETDVLIVGSGGAALRAAIAARVTLPADRCVLVAAKGALGASGVTAKACSDRMAFHATLPETEPAGPDNWRFHADDVFQIGGYVSDEDLAETLGVGQDTISRLEKRSDMLLSTLRHYVESVGGRLALVATFPDQRAVIIDHLGESRTVKKRGDGRGKAAADESEGPDARDDSNPLLPDR